MDDLVFQRYIEQAHEHILKAQAFIVPLVRRMSGKSELLPLQDLSEYLQKARSKAEELSKL